jgi:predicted RNA-binding Zn-ribbon protein involved in translation (DUF1610 family)
MSHYKFYTSDPSDGFDTDHFSNAETEVIELSCPYCGETENLVDDTPDCMKNKSLYICEGCGQFFEVHG